MAKKKNLTIAAVPNPGPEPVRREDVPTVPSSPYLPGKSPFKKGIAGLQIDPEIKIEFTFPKRDNKRRHEPGGYYYGTPPKEPYWKRRKSNTSNIA